MKDQVLQNVMTSIHQEPHFNVTLVTGKDVKKALSVILVEAGLPIDAIAHSVQVKNDKVSFITKIKSKALKGKQQVSALPTFTSVGASDNMLDMVLAEVEGILYTDEEQLKISKEDKHTLIKWNPETLLRRIVDADLEDPSFGFRFQNQSEKKKKVSWVFQVSTMLAESTYEDEEVHGDDDFTTSN